MVRRRSAGSLTTILAGATNGSLRAIATINATASARRCARGRFRPGGPFEMAPQIGNSLLKHRVRTRPASRILPSSLSSRATAP
jgi:hypothetical protein